jgi:hypothetical protein
MIQFFRRLLMLRSSRDNYAKKVLWFREGEVAAQENKALADCPYQKGSAASGSYNAGRCDWFTGYLAAKHKKMFPKWFKEQA